MANKFDGDVRPLSNDPRYMGAPFSGSIKSAIKQAKAAPDHGMPEQPGKPAHISRSRWNLLEHLNLTARYEDRNYVVPAGSDRVISKYSLDYAMKQWPQHFNGSYFLGGKRSQS